MQKGKIELSAELEKKRKHFIKYFVFSEIGITLFYVILFYFLNFELIVYINLAAACIVYYLYRTISKFDFNFKALTNFGLSAFAAHVYINVLFLWNSNPIVYLLFFPFPIAAFIFYNLFSQE